MGPMTCVQASLFEKIGCTVNDLRRLVDRVRTARLVLDTPAANAILRASGACRSRAAVDEVLGLLDVEVVR